MTISREDDDEIQQLLDEVVWNIAVECQIPFSRLAFNPEQIKRIETKLKSENTNDTN